jgi:pimeloyl-ACP methyl ester carboxylesterase
VDSVSANGLSFAYLAEGEGPLVLLLHGFPDTPHTWRHVMPALAAAGYRAVAPFLRGYHPTQIPASGPFAPETLGRDALALIEALGAADAIVVGHDWGASAAYAAATINPSSVRLLVTIGVPHPRSLKPTLKLAWTMRHAFVLRGKRGGARLRAREFAYLDTLVRRWSPAWHDMPADEFAEAKAALGHPGSAEAASAYYASIGTKVPAVLRGKTRVPTVAFAGEHDVIEPRVYEKARHCFESSYEVIQMPGGHFMHREHPDHFTTELLRVLGDHAQRRSVRGNM